eukprot:jgi/Mesvir1/27352/Mv07165-RA.1
MQQSSPSNPVVGPLLTDMYQISMAYGYWLSGKASQRSVFDLFIRKCPFKGAFYVFAGLSECIKLLSTFRFLPEDIEYLRSILPAHCDPAFFEYLSKVDASHVELRAAPEGTVMFPSVPVMTLAGPLLVCQLLETAFLNLVNYASLVATNAARFRIATGPSKVLLEFGLRRAQGPDGGLSASRYSFLGGFDATSNVEAGRRFGIPVRGTMAHSFISSFTEENAGADAATPAATPCLPIPPHFKGKPYDPDLLASAQSWLQRLQAEEGLGIGKTNISELESFVAYASAFPNTFLALADTYDVMRSGVPNFMAVGLALADRGAKPVGIRLDSGDLATLSLKAKSLFREADARLGGGRSVLSSCTITASDNIDEERLRQLDKQGHEIDCFGIGTNLVTCAGTPAIGGVYKLVEIEGQPRIKLSEDAAKTTIPGRKAAYRLYGKDGCAALDVLLLHGEEPPKVGEPFLCRDPFTATTRVKMSPSRVQPLHRTFWPPTPSGPPRAGQQATLSSPQPAGTGGSSSSPSPAGNEASSASPSTDQVTPPATLLESKECCRLSQADIPSAVMRLEGPARFPEKEPSLRDRRKACVYRVS